MGDDAAAECMATAYDAGVNFFDNAEVYAAGESERIMGRTLKKLGWGRDTYCVSSKVYWGGDRPTQRGLSRKHIHDACHAALDVCRSTTSICSSATAPTSRPRSRRPCARCTT